MNDILEVDVEDVVLLLGVLPENWLQVLAVGVLGRHR